MNRAELDALIQAAAPSNEQIAAVLATLEEIMAETQEAANEPR